MPTPSSGRDSRRSSKSGPSGNDAHKSSNSDRREKTKSAQVYDDRRRGSRQTESGLGSVSERPQLTSRTNSAPLLEPGARYGGARGEQTSSARTTASSTSKVGSEDAGDAQDEDEVAGVVGAVRHFQPFQNPEVGRQQPYAKRQS